MGFAPLVTEHNSVGVVIPTFNSAQTIERALTSVINQSVPPTQVVVVDNASSDHTLQTVSRMAEATPHLDWSIVKLTTNGGPGHARNVGWDQCTTSLIAFLDSDDAWHPEKIKRQLAVVDAHPTHQLFGHRYAVITDENTDDHDIPAGSGKIMRYGLRHFLIRNRVSTPTVMLRRNLPHRFPSDPWFAEDFALWTKILADGQLAVVLDLELTYLYKATYGESGLSAKMTEMHQGEIAAIRNLYTKRVITWFEYRSTKVWMWVKFVRRHLTVSHDE